jgi:hypothetical protein
MKAPRFAVLTLSLDTSAYRLRRPDERSHKIAYLLDRLLAGEEIAESELRHYGIRVAVREAVKGEIL